jgi:hypothetical protein
MQAGIRRLKQAVLGGSEQVREETPGLVHIGFQRPSARVSISTATSASDIDCDAGGQMRQLCRACRVDFMVQVWGSYQGHCDMRPGFLHVR